MINPGYKTNGVAMCLNVFLTPNPEVKIQVRDLVQVVGIVDLFAPQGGQYSGKVRFVEPQGVNGHRIPVLGGPSSAKPRESQAKFRDRTMWGL